LVRSRQGFNQVFCGGTTGTGKTVNVTVAGAAASDYVTMALGPSASFSFSGLSQPFQNVPDGAVDLLAARATAVGQLPNKLFALRGINPAAGSTVSVDFNGSNALDPVSAQLTIANLGADQAAFVATYSSANRGSLGYAIDAQLSTATTRTFNGFPTSAGSFHTLFVTAYPNTQTPDRYRLAGVVFASVAAKTVTLGPDMSTVAVTAAATTPVLRPQAVIPTSAQYNSFWVMTGSQTGSAPRSASVQISAAYLGTIPASVTAVVPDLSSAGYNTMWGLANTASTTWSVTATGTSGLGALGQNQEGATIAVGARQGTLPPQP
jgi:hypothetical protein